MKRFFFVVIIFNYEKYNKHIVTIGRRNFLLKQSLKDIFPSEILNFIEMYDVQDNLQEIRVKINKPCILIYHNKEKISDFIVNNDEFKFILSRISNYSLYAFEEDIKQGFITISGGHRVGIAGECVIENGAVKTIRNIASLNFRICREIIGASKKVERYIFSDNKIYNTIIISPPKCGKTTILRDIARNLSDRGNKVTIIDERSEIASCYQGVPQMNIGIRSDVLDNCLKSQGMIMAVRSLSPDVIICDEIGKNEDVEALCTAFNSGVKIIVTIHGYDICDVLKRDVFKKMIKNKLLDRAIVLTNFGGVGSVKNIYDLSTEGGEPLCLK